MSFKNTLALACDNGHKPGHVFSDDICFCQKCHVPLTFQDYRRTGCFALNGLSGSKCNEQ